jgi:hypothetical protein
LAAFNEWYISRLKAKFELIDRSNNSYFLGTFVREYLAISESLIDIKSFDISYKVTFFL